MKIKANKEIRIDKYLSDLFEEIPREMVKDFIKDVKIKINNKKIKPSYKLIFNDDRNF
ncbi:MAG: S4 domain-containing protein [Anaerococcus sp.]